VLVTDLYSTVTVGKSVSLNINFPALVLYCSSKTCSGDRIFTRVGSSEWLRAGESRDLFIPYLCKNCENDSRTYAVRLRLLGDPKDKDKFGLAAKFGEQPPFGPK